MKKKLTIACILVCLAAVGTYSILAFVAWRTVPKMVNDVERRLFGVRLAIARLEQDQILLSQRIQAVTDQTLGKGLPKEEEVAALLADPDINRLAFVYLGADWAIQRSGLVGSAAHLRDLFNQQKSDRQGARNRLDRREAEDKRKIKELERRKRSLGLQLTTLNRRGNGFASKQLELEDVERQIALYRDRRVYWETQRFDDAQRNKTDEVFAEARAKTEAEVFRLASEYQAQTVGTLTRVMAAKLSELKLEANRPTHIRRFMSPFNIWPVNRICRMTLEGEDAKQL